MERFRAMLLAATPWCSAEASPGLQDEMIAAGVPLVDMANDIA